MRARALASLAVLASTLAPAAARAQDNSAAVEALFEDGKKLEAAGDYAGACPKFLASYNLEHRTGTLLNLADCYEKTGMLASAWARFVEARTMAQRAGQQDRADFAAQHAAELEKRFAKLTIIVPGGVAGLRVTRDGEPVDAAVFGVAVPVDPGDHVIEASAPGKLPWKDTARVAGEATTATIQVPTLQDAPVATPAPSPSPTPSPTPGPTPGPSPVPSPMAATESGGTSGRKILGMSLAGAGVVAAGVGGVFGVMALGKKSQSDPYCGIAGNANACYPPGVQPRKDAIGDGNLATVFLGAGAAMVAGGLVVWLTAPSASATSVGFDGRGVVVSGAF